MIGTLKKSLFITVITLLVGSIISYLYIEIIGDKIEYTLAIKDLPVFWDIFINNSKFIFIYTIPLVGALYYSINFIYIFFMIGSSINNFGLMYTLCKLVHLPLEVFALSIPLIYSIRIFRNWVKNIDIPYREIISMDLLSLFVIFISAFIESLLV